MKNTQAREAAEKDRPRLEVKVGSRSPLLVTQLRAELSPSMPGDRPALFVITVVIRRGRIVYPSSLRDRS